tara:strand:- start:659 stop:949 length:291 start_codon:yes stop_codon:yes gene_type:complete
MGLAHAPRTFILDQHEMMLSTWGWPDHAKEYWGGDVQEFAFVRDSLWRGTGGYEYHIWQRPHWGNKRKTASTYGCSSREAAQRFIQISSEHWRLCK